jgi:hypothetical protein
MLVDVYADGKTNDELIDNMFWTYLSASPEQMESFKIKFTIKK